MRREVPIRYPLGTSERRVTLCWALPLTLSRDIAHMELVRFASEAYEAWKAAEAAQPCPPSLQALNVFTNKKDIRDPWGRDYRFLCDPEAREMLAVSAGPDGHLGTADDISSDRQAR